MITKTNLEIKNFLTTKISDKINEQNNFILLLANINMYKNKYKNMLLTEVERYNEIFRYNSFGNDNLYYLK